MTPLKQLFRQPVRLFAIFLLVGMASACLLYTSPSPRD